MSQESKKEFDSQFDIKGVQKTAEEAINGKVIFSITDNGEGHMMNYSDGEAGEILQGICHFLNDLCKETSTGRASLLNHLSIIMLVQKLEEGGGMNGREDLHKQ